MNLIQRIMSLSFSAYIFPLYFLLSIHVLFFRELGYLFHQIMRNLAAGEKKNNQTVAAEAERSDEKKDTTNNNTTNESEGDTAEIRYDHTDYHHFKRYSHKYVLKREAFLKNLVFRDWLTEKNVM